MEICRKGGACLDVAISLVVGAVIGVVITVVALAMIMGKDDDK